MRDPSSKSRVGAGVEFIDSNKIGEGVVKREKKRETPFKTS